MTYIIVRQHYLKQNIIRGDALTLQTVGDPPRPIIFPEWSPIKDGLFKRRDFTFHELLNHEKIREQPLFSDQGEDVFIPAHVKEYPPVHFTRIGKW